MNVVITFVAFALGCYISTNKELDFIHSSQFWIASGVLCGITATGYWINDVFDFKIDRINKPSRLIVNSFLSQKKVLSIYFAILVILVFVSFRFLPLRITIINLIAVAMLFVYSVYLKRVSVAGNLLIATLTALVIYLAAFMFDTMNWPLVWTMVFAFQITFLREVVKDVEDIRGDLKYKLRTLPIQIGLDSTKKVLFVVYIIFIISCWLPVIQEFSMYGKTNWLYIIVSLLLVQTPAVIMAKEVQRYSEPSQFRWQSNALKLIIFTGIFSVVLLN